ncbi:drug/metabolite transporter permease [Bifidobacterium aerophilum]|uniref:EamA family transporter n=1 Tax=Bifidobacterium aerophilum TaxID=1798155 RepID=A0A6N9Z5T8_9BIFI|nr:drug/metabolite transporter permease [Bifidobacterium aerophilum]NEG89485.1 EamA family transporter [Bifidobacterium aerophilum]
MTDHPQQSAQQQPPATHPASAGHVVSSGATTVGLCAILLWSMMTGLVRVVADSFGATLGSTLIYTTGVILLMIFHRPAPLREYPRKYLLFGGLLFVFYESSISLSVGLASTAASSVEVSLVNYLWPTMMVLLTAAVFPTVRRRGGTTADDGGAHPSRLRSVLRVLPGAIVATAGVVLAVGGNSGLDWGLAAQHIASNPLPYLLAFCGASAWSVYAVFTPAMADGKDGTSVFFPFVAAALWVIHFTSGEGWPTTPPSIWGYLAVLGAAASIAGGYACWGHGILHGSMRTLAMASYAAPVLSTAASAVLLGLALSLPFWCGALLVAAGSILNWWISSRRK